MAFTTGTMRSMTARHQAFAPARAGTGAPPSLAKASVRCRSVAADTDASSSRREVLGGAVGLAVASLIARPPTAALAANGLPDEQIKLLCGPECVAELESKQLITTASGLQYRDVVEGKGPTPPIGFQVVVNYVAMTPNGRAFDSSLEKGKPYDVRVGGGQVIPGLDEGLLTMRPGGLRRLYIPGSLAFPKGLKAAAGRPSVPPSSPVMFDVQLLYIPGMEVDEE